MMSDSYLSVFTPLVLLADLSLFFGGEVVDDVESLANLLGGLALDHGRDSSARQVKQRLDVHEVGGQNELKENLLLNVDEVCIPLLDDLTHLCRLQWLCIRGSGGGSMKGIKVRKHNSKPKFRIKNRK